ncbi:hypothetical protein [Pelosinus sp. IPA-1]|uniref:hypothetical protein n=1 Tax=Pelosinus sp. IPA-1 TaxID=3029569 RepID=UPI0024362776|nr:hypothetical protein [Pelosinus sp. IPA-1]GMB00450.1 hypothetical protein PIPA1_32490 [Pelosinus sp. IPA-1]
MKWLTDHISIVAISITLIGLIFVFLSWAVGYYANGLYGSKFELASCWQGLAAIGSPGLLGLLKWIIDSFANSAKNKMPGEDS